MAFVYLLCDSGHDNMFKIGMTRGDVEKRIKKLQTGNGSEIFLVKKYETKYPFYLEKMLHQRHWPERKLNEWFELSTESVMNFEEDCKFYEDIVELLSETNPFFNIKKIK